MSDTHTESKPGAYSKKLGEVALPRGGSAVFNKPRMTRHHELLRAAPTFVDAIRQAQERALLMAYKDRLEDLSAAEERDAAEIAFCEQMIGRLTERVSGSTEAVQAAAPPEEVAAVAAFLAEHTRDLRGVSDHDWREMDEEARVEFWDLIGPGIGTVLSRVLSLVKALSHPEAD